ncbi:hypothetical protein V491_04101 [Pseudogymnoascus sp. VKM F-3775]|nr:hypothetical protein V491_04101 [Pseudogymnoascus sp. VKM F-3775]
MQDTLPLQVDPLGSQKNASEIGNSFWSSSFIHGSNNHDYLVVSHVLTNLAVVPYANSVYRASVLDITDPSQYARFEFFSNISTAFPSNGDFNVTLPDYGFSTAGPAGDISKLRTWSYVPGAEFDLQFDLSAPVLLNGGLGDFNIGSTTVHEWGMPAGNTAGWLAINGTKVVVDTKQSLTWYDRQWGGAPQNWTWFEVHINSGNPELADIPLSIWVWGDEESGIGGFASIREAGMVQSVIPVTSLEPSNRTYTSKETGVVYSLDWTLNLADGTEFFVSSVREDQELYALGGIFPTYEGYITVTGTYRGIWDVKGYGLVEISPLTG